MSRIGKKPVKIPENVTVDINDSLVVVGGPRGELHLAIPSGITLLKSDVAITVQLNEKSSTKRAKSSFSTTADYGRIRAQLANMVHGVTEGFSRTLEVVGTGFRATTDGKTLTLALGFSHPVVVEAPEGINFTVATNKITIEGISKELVGQVAANVRRMKPPDPYKGKGIKYEEEIIRKKPGKAAKGVGAAA
ncbi:50S ribosomal protein L6 [Candidatus Microgenomates bacterium]|nr:50S ribosomal protein L6 [Candidatus Microgenomates bacterium]